MGAINLSASLGGSIYIRGVTSRLIPYDNGTGNVPAGGTVISGVSGSGKLVGVYSALNVVPSAPAASMPSTGYILLKQWNGNGFVENESLTGIGADVDVDPTFGGTDRVGWVELVGQEGSNLSNNRINNPTQKEAIGDWFYMGITTGTRTTAYQIPSNGVAQHISGVQVETDVDSNEYEWWPVSTSDMTLDNIKTSGEGTNVCFLDSANARIYFGYDLTNQSGGQCPTAGRRVRIGNVLMQMCLNASPTANSFNVAPATRYRVLTSGSGNWRTEKISCAWGMQSISNPYIINLQDSSFIAPMTVFNCPTILEIRRCCISKQYVEGSTGNHPLLINNCSTGSNIEDSVFSNGGPLLTTSTHHLYINLSENVVVSNCKMVNTGMSNAYVAVLLSLSINILIEDCTVIGGIYETTQCSNIRLYNHKWAMSCAGVPWVFSTAQTFMLYIRNTTSDLVFDGLEMAHDGQGPVNDAIYIIGSSNNIKIRNWGTYDNPLHMGGDIVDATFTRSGTVATVTSPGHGFTDPPLIGFKWTSPSSGSLTAAAKRVATVPTADTFTLAATNSGDTSGTLRYFISNVQRVFNTAAGTTNVEIQNVHIAGTRNAVVATANTNSNISTINVSGDVSQTMVLGANNAVTRALQGGGGLPGTTISQFGHTFTDIFVTPLDVNLGATSWTRVTSTGTFTRTDHNLDNQQARLRAFNSSDTATIPNGWRSGLNIVSNDVFTTGVTNTGSTSGTADIFIEDSRLIVFMNEESDSVQTYDIDAGDPVFTGAGTFSATTTGDQITWTMPEYLINYTGFSELPLFTNLTETPSTVGVYDMFYDIAVDGGAFTGTFKNLLYPRTGTNVTASSTTITMADTTGVQAGDYVFGKTTAYPTKVVSVDSGTTITVDTPALANSTDIIWFYHLPNETFTDSFRLKIRLRANTDNIQTLNYIAVPLVSDATSRAKTYPIEELVPITIEVIGADSLAPVENARVYLKASSGGPIAEGTLIATGLTNSSGMFTSQFAYNTDQPVRGWVRRATTPPLYRQSQLLGTITSNGYNNVVSLVRDE